MWYIIILVLMLFYLGIRSQKNNIWLLEKISIIHKFKPLLTLICYIIIFLNLYYSSKIEYKYDDVFHGMLLLISYFLLLVVFAILIHIENMLIFYIIFCFLSLFVSSITISGNDNLPRDVNNVAFVVGILQLLIPIYVVLIDYTIQNMEKRKFVLSDEIKSIFTIPRVILIVILFVIFHESLSVFMILLVFIIIVYRAFPKKYSGVRFDESWLYKKDVPQFTDPKTGIQYHHSKSRYYFHRELHDLCYFPFNSYSLNAITMCERENDRIVGAYMVFDSYKLRNNISQNVKRNDALRSYISIPGRELVKGRYTEKNGKRYYHYHATHLIPFRLCLNDGHYGDIMFMGTANLNSGTRVEYGWKPNDLIKNNRVTSIMSIVGGNINDKNINIKEYFRIPRTCDHDDSTFSSSENIPQNNYYSLDDFERVIDEYVKLKKDNYVWKYGVECFYNEDNNTAIPNYIEIVFSNLTNGENIFVARVDNNYL